MKSIESVLAYFHLLEHWKSHNKLGLRRNITDFQVQYIFTIGVNCPDCNLPSFLFGLLELLLSLLLLFNNALDFGIREFDFEFVYGWLRMDGERKINLQELLEWIVVFLREGDAKQTVDYFQLIVNML